MRLSAGLGLPLVAYRQITPLWAFSEARFSMQRDVNNMDEGTWLSKNVGYFQCKSRPENRALPPLRNVGEFTWLFDAQHLD